MPRSAGEMTGHFFPDMSGPLIQICVTPTGLDWIVEALSHYESPCHKKGDMLKPFVDQLNALNQQVKAALGGIVAGR